MANVLRIDRQEQVRALGRLGWSLRRIRQVTGVHRETARAVSRRSKPFGQAEFFFDPWTPLSGATESMHAKCVCQATPTFTT